MLENSILDLPFSLFLIEHSVVTILNINLFSYLLTDYIAFNMLSISTSILVLCHVTLLSLEHVTHCSRIDHVTHCPRIDQLAHYTRIVHVTHCTRKVVSL